VAADHACAACPWRVAEDILFDALKVVAGKLSMRTDEHAHALLGTSVGEGV
jgi:hypothetical protein